MDLNQLLNSEAPPARSEEQAPRNNFEEPAHRAPKVGEIVFFRDRLSPECMPAMVCHVHNDLSTLNLCIFRPDGIPMPLRGVPEHQEADRGPSWHWELK